MKLRNIVYLSQFRDIADPERQQRACAITCLSMALKFLHPNDAPAPDELFDEGVTIHAIDSNKNWTHVGITHIARNHGVHAYSEEFKSLMSGTESKYQDTMVLNGIKKIREHLDRGLVVMASVGGRRFGGPHSILIIGYEIERDGVGFWFHNPDTDTAEEGTWQYMSPEDFRKKWRKLAIFLGPTIV